MKKKISTGIALGLAMLGNTLFAQTAAGVIDPHTHVRCVSEIEFQEEAAKDPSALARRVQFEKFSADYIKSNQSANQVATANPRIIPVVVHVLHQNGPENISKAQIQDQINILNKDFRRLNADTASTPLAFRGVAADCNIEFRLAQKDPNGNCTDGIERIETHLTKEAIPRNRLKINQWDPTKYLNIWIVVSIYAQGSPGTVLGYAQFPTELASKPGTDGVVVRHDYFGNSGTAIFSGNAGRVATHEVGHWLGLRHIWGDEPACAQDDGVSDTPIEADQVFGCPTPIGTVVTDACSPNAPGIMYMNYMDYTDGDCQNIFTNGQKGKMDATLASTGARSVLTTAANNIATGTDGSPAVTCAPKAEICFDNKDIISVPYDFICAGDSVKFIGVGYNADVINYSWSFPGGTPSNSTLASPFVTYSSSGKYSATLVVSNSAGSNTYTLNDCVIVSGGADSKPSPSITENFEVSSSFPGKGYINNPDNSRTWTRVTNAGFSGTSSIMVENFNYYSGEVDQYITPSFDLSGLLNPKLEFRLANAQDTTGTDSQDALNVYMSQTCGKSWIKRLSLTGSSLATTTPKSTSFLPSSSSQWRYESFVLLTGDNSRVRFMFENITDGGNNTYIDDIVVSGTVGINEIDFEVSNMQLYPNPSAGNVSVTYAVSKLSDVRLEVRDLLGKQVQMLEKKNQVPGIHLTNIDVSNLSKGVYFVCLKTDKGTITKRLMVD